MKPETEIRPREDAVIVFIELSSAAHLHRRKRQEKEASRGGSGLGNDTFFVLITSDRGLPFERPKVMFFFVHKPTRIAMLVPAWLPPVYVCFCEVLNLLKEARAMNLVFLLCFLASVVEVLW